MNTRTSRSIPLFVTTLLGLVATLPLVELAESQNGPRQAEMALPFPSSEKLVFEVRFSRFPISSTVGVVTFDYRGDLAVQPNSSIAAIPGASIELKPLEGESLIGLRASAVSQGFVISLLGFDFQGRFETLVAKRDFSARLSFKEEKEGKKHTAQTSEFDPLVKKIRYVTQDLVNPQAAPRILELPLRERTQSLLSSFYYLRLQPLTEGQLICFPVSQDEQNHEFEIFVRGREVIEIGREKVMTVKAEAKVFGPGRFFATRQGEMNLWLSDDERRVPVRMIAKTNQGTVTANLINYRDQPPLRQISKPVSNR